MAMPSPPSAPFGIRNRASVVECASALALLDTKRTTPVTRTGLAWDKLVECGRDYALRSLRIRFAPNGSSNSAPAIIVVGSGTTVTVSLPVYPRIAYEPVIVRGAFSIIQLAVSSIAAWLG